MTMLDAITGPIRRRIVSAGETIIREGEPGTTLYIVVAGLVEVLVGGISVATVGPGGIVGEMAVITGQPRSATVVARTTTWLTPIDGRHVAHLVQHSPYFAPQLLEQLSERLREAYRLIASGHLPVAAPAVPAAPRAAPVGNHHAAFVLPLPPRTTVVAGPRHRRWRSRSGANSGPGHAQQSLTRGIRPC